MHEEVMLLHQKILRGKEEIDMCNHDLKNIFTNIRFSLLEYLENQIHHLKTDAPMDSYAMGLCSLMESKLNHFRKLKFIGGKMWKDWYILTNSVNFYCYYYTVV